eukprot:8897490-Prorocentrum_lima.AAC.1
MKPNDLIPTTEEEQEVAVLRLVARLRAGWPDGTIKKLPRLDRRFFKEICFNGDMDEFLTTLTQAE